MIKQSGAIVAGVMLLVLNQPAWSESLSDAQPQTMPETRTTNAPVNIQNLFTPSGWMGDGEFGKKYVQFGCGL